ncbi:MAG: hypothetical protein AAF488_04195 [Planctomycetota bacterium]
MLLRSSIAIAVLWIGVSSPAGFGDAPSKTKPVDAKEQIRAAIRQLGESRGYAMTWRIDLELSDSKDHARDKTAFFQEYDVEVHAARLKAKALDFYRDGQRTAIGTPRGYRGASGHPVGKWLAHLLVRPETLLHEIRSCRPTFPLSPSSDEKVDRSRVIATLSSKVATLHWERVVQSRCIAGKLEDVPVLLSRVDPSRKEGSAIVRLDPKTGHPLAVDIVVAIALASPPGAPKQTDPMADWREEEHLVVRQSYRLSRFGEVEAIEIPAEARRALAK